MTTKIPRKPRPDNLLDYKTNQELRTKYFLHTCKEKIDREKGNTNHIWCMDVPKGKRTQTVSDYYNLGITQEFPKKMWGKRVLLLWSCILCKKVLVTKPKICTDCGRAIKPISKKMEKHMQLFIRLKCRCT